MLQLASFEDEEEPNGNFDLLLEFRPDDFKEFKDIAKNLNEFRLQSLALKQRWRELSNRVKSYEDELVKIDEVSRFLTSDEDWQKRVLEVKDEYIKKVQYDKAKEELTTLESQRAASETISKEFKVELSQGFTCAICYENSVSLFLDPCGHMTCGPCWSKVTCRAGVKLCPCCRTAATGKKIYLV